MRYPATLRMFLHNELCLTATIYSGSTALAEVGALLSPNCYIDLKRVTCQQVPRTLIHHVTVSLWFGCACILGFNMKHNIRCPEYINLKHEKWETAKPRPPPRQY